MSSTTATGIMDVPLEAPGAEAPREDKTFLERALNTIERVGNKVPHPAIIFVALIAIVAVLSHILYVMKASVTFDALDAETGAIAETTTYAQSLLTADGIRFMYE